MNGRDFFPNLTNQRATAAADHERRERCEGMPREAARDQYMACVMRAPGYGAEWYRAWAAGDDLPCVLEVGPAGLAVHAVASADTLRAPWTRVGTLAHAKARLEVALGTTTTADGRNTPSGPKGSRIAVGHRSATTAGLGAANGGGGGGGGGRRRSAGSGAAATVSTSATTWVLRFQSPSVCKAVWVAAVQQHVHRALPGPGIAALHARGDTRGWVDEQRLWQGACRSILGKKVKKAKQILAAAVAAARPPPPDDRHKVTEAREESAATGPVRPAPRRPHKPPPSSMLPSRAAPRPVVATEPVRHGSGKGAAIHSTPATAYLAAGRVGLLGGAAVGAGVFVVAVSGSADDGGLEVGDEVVAVDGDCCAGLDVGLVARLIAAASATVNGVDLEVTGNAVGLAALVLTTGADVAALEAAGGHDPTLAAAEAHVDVAVPSRVHVRRTDTTGCWELQLRPSPKPQPQSQPRSTARSKPTLGPRRLREMLSPATPPPPLPPPAGAQMAELLAKVSPSALGTILSDVRHEVHAAWSSPRRRRSICSAPPQGVRPVTITLEQNNSGSYGFTFTGGVECGQLPTVSRVRAVGVVQPAPRGLEVGDTILAINGHSLARATHDGTAALLRGHPLATLVVLGGRPAVGWGELDVESGMQMDEVPAEARDAQDESLANHNHDQVWSTSNHIPRLAGVRLHRCGGRGAADPFGVALAHVGAGCVVVRAAPGSDADRAGVAGAELIMVNGTDVTGLQLDEVEHCVATAGDTADFIFAVPSTTPQGRVGAAAPPGSTEPPVRAVKLKRRRGDSFGMTLAADDDGLTRVTRVAPGSPADGKVEADDCILAINARSLFGPHAADAMDDLKFEDTVTIEVQSHTSALLSQLLRQHPGAHLVETTLRSGTGGFGLQVVVADTAFGTLVRVVGVLEGSEAAEMGLVEEEDVIIEINGRPVGDLTHDAVLDALTVRPSNCHKSHCLASPAVTDTDGDVDDGVMAVEDSDSSTDEGDGSNDDHCSAIGNRDGSGRGMCASAVTLQLLRLRPRVAGLPRAVEISLDGAAAAPSVEVAEAIAPRGRARVCGAVGPPAPSSVGLSARAPLSQLQHVV